MNSPDESEDCEPDCDRPPEARLAGARFSDEVVERAAQFMRAAGDPSRLRILEHLVAGSACVSELAQHFSVAASTISQQLKTLHSAGLLRRRREGKHVYYSLADAHVAELISNSLEHAQEG